MIASVRGFAVLALLSAASTATTHAQDTGPCNSEKVLGRCEAMVTADGDEIVLRANRTCAVVEWRLAGQSRSTTVVDSVKRVEKTAGETGKPEVMRCSAVEDFRGDESCDRALARAQEYLRVVDQPYPNVDTEQIRRLRNSIIEQTVPPRCMQAPPNAAATPRVDADPVGPRENAPAR